MAFKTAGSMAFQAAMDKATPVLLEPVMKLEISTPDEFYGDVLGDVMKRARAGAGLEDQRGNLKVIRATGSAGGDVRLRYRTCAR